MDYKKKIFSKLDKKSYSNREILINRINGSFSQIESAIAGIMNLLNDSNIKDYDEFTAYAWNISTLKSHSNMLEQHIKDWYNFNNKKPVESYLPNDEKSESPVSQMKPFRIGK